MHNPTEIKLELMTKGGSNYLAVSLSWKDAEAIAKLRTFDGRWWNPDAHKWILPIRHLDQVKQIFPEAYVSEGIVKYQEQKRSDLQVKLSEFNKLVDGLNFDSPLPDGRTLFAHQKGGVFDLLKTRKAILAYDMGLGKTLIALVAAKVLQQRSGNPRLIVICPVSLKENWQREAFSINLMNIEIHSWSKIPPVPFKDFILIADECHYAQSGTRSQRGKAFLELSKSKYCKSCFCLSGTPIKNGRPINLLPLLEAVGHALAKDKKYYHIRYCDAKRTRFSKWDTTGAVHLEELHQKTKDVMFRKTKKECLDLPEKLRVIRKAELSAAAEKAYNEALSDLKHKYDERIASGQIIGGNDALVLLGHLRHAGSIGKAETAIELAQEILEEGGSVVIFTEYRKSAYIISEYFLKSNIGCELLTGDTVDRQGCVDRFQSGKSKVFVGTIKAGGVGLTLTRAQTVILVDRPWTPGDCEQAEDRLHRIGQKNQVTAVWLQYGKADELVDKMLTSKTAKIDIMLEGKIAAEVLSKITSK